MDQLANDLAETGRGFYQRGWVLGTSGNFSARLQAAPLRLLISSSGKEKGRLTPSDFLTVDESGKAIAGGGKPSAETSLHIVIAELRGAGSILHTHSVWSTMLSDRYAGDGHLIIEGYEMLKGLSGVPTHEHRELVPILENSQDYAALSTELRGALLRHPSAHGVLLRRHGLYTWGADLAEARRHVEIFEFLFEVLGRQL